MGDNDAGETADAFYQQRENSKSLVCSLALIPELNTETERAIQDQWGLGLQLVQASHAVLHVATQRHLSEIVQPLCIAEDGLHCHQDLGVQPETAGQVRSRGVVAKKEELGGGRVRC